MIYARRNYRNMLYLFSSGSSCELVKSIDLITFYLKSKTGWQPDLIRLFLLDNRIKVFLFKKLCDLTLF